MLFISRILTRRSNASAQFKRSGRENPLKATRGTRECRGWLKDPLKSVEPDIPTHDNRTNILDSPADRDKKIIASIIGLRGDADKQGAQRSVYQLGEEYLDRLFELHKSLPPLPERVRERVTQILESRFNYNNISDSRRRCPRSVFFANDSSDSPGPPKSLFCETYKVRQSQEPPNSHDTQPTHLSSEFPDYFAIRRSAALFERTSAVLLAVSGRNSDHLMNQILAASVKDIPAEEVQYSCVLDSKGVILDTCFVARHEGCYVLATTGNRKNDVLDYVGSYAVHLRGFGLDVAVRPLEGHRVVDLYGPLSAGVLTSLLDGQTEFRAREADGSAGGGKVEPLRLLMRRFYIDHLNSPQSIICYRVSDVEDGFEFLVPEELHPRFVELLLSNDHVTPVGPEAYEAARLESGVLRPDVDLTPETTPMHASLMWNVDVGKVRGRGVFGHRNLGRTMLEGVSKIRVGLLSNRALTRSCTVLSQSTRMPIGIVSSAAFSPGLGVHIAHCYVNREHARHGTPVVVSAPELPAESVDRRTYRRLSRNGTLKRLFRGTLVRLPFVNPSYQLGQARKGREEREPRCPEVQVQRRPALPPEPRDQPKSRGQMWKEIVRRHKRRATGTLEMALARWERINRESTEEAGPEEAREGQGVEGSENTFSNRAAGIEPVLKYYRDMRENEAGSRHRRFRPTRHTYWVE